MNDAGAAPRATRREWIGLAVIALPCLLYAMDLTVLFLAVPSLSADLNPSSTQLLWITDIYGFIFAGSPANLLTGSAVPLKGNVVASNLPGANMFAPFRLGRAAAIAAALLASPVSLVFAQSRDTDAEGAESCRAIWREYGRTMSGRPYAVHCEIREAGSFAPRGVIDVEGAEHHGVKIVGSQRSDVRVRLVIQTQGRTVEEARELARQVTLDLTRVPLRADVPDVRDTRRSGRRFVSATVVIDAPIESNISARVRHAPLDVENVRGRIDVVAEHGPLTLHDVGGDVRARSRHGPLSVRLTTSRWQGTGLDAVATHGPMTLYVPRDFGAELEIGAEHGPLHVDFPLTLTRFDASLIRTRLGAGGPRVRAVAEHGPMSLRMER